MRKTSLVVDILFFVFGVGCIIFGIDALRSQSANWPRVTGQSTGGTIHSSDGVDVNDKTEYYVSVEYKYVVSDTTYTGTFDHLRRSTETEAQADLNAFTAGQEIAVFYDPANPGRSTTSPGELEFFGVIGLIAGVICMIIGGSNIRQAYVLSKKLKASTTKDQTWRVS